jgi:hypothetical protein
MVQLKAQAIYFAFAIATHSMHALPAIKQAALEALETEDGPGDLAGFFSLIDPQSVLELVEIAETRITDEEVQALHQVIAVLCNCIRRTTADPASIELTRHARMVGATSRGPS